MRYAMDGKRESGFSLLEVLVAMVLVGIIGIVASNVLTQGVKQSRRMAEEFDMRSAGLAALRELEVGYVDGALGRIPGLMSANELTVQSDSARPYITFTGEDGTYNDINIAIAHENDALVRRVAGGPGHTLLTDVAEFTVCAQAPAPSEGAAVGTGPGRTIAIDLKLRRDGEPERKVDLGTEIYVRNILTSNFNVAPCVVGP